MPAAAKSRSPKKNHPAAPGPFTTEVLAVHGPPDPDRVLTTNFDKFVDTLAASPDPRVEDVSRLSAGSDLILGIIDGDLRFGNAAPTVPQDSDLADRILALTDDAFGYAHRILEQDAYNTAYYENEEHQRMCENMETTLTLLDYTEGDTIFRRTCGQLILLEGAEDPAAAKELL